MNRKIERQETEKGGLPYLTGTKDFNPPNLPAHTPTQTPSTHTHTHTHSHTHTLTHTLRSVADSQHRLQTAHSLRAQAVKIEKILLLQTQTRIHTHIYTQRQT